MMFDFRGLRLPACWHGASCPYWRAHKCCFGHRDPPDAEPKDDDAKQGHIHMDESHLKEQLTKSMQSYCADIITAVGGIVAKLEEFRDALAAPWLQIVKPEPGPKPKQLAGGHQHKRESTAEQQEPITYAAPPMTYTTPLATQELMRRLSESIPYAAPPVTHAAPPAVREPKTLAAPLGRAERKGKGKSKDKDKNLPVTTEQLGLSTPNARLSREGAPSSTGSNDMIDRSVKNSPRRKHPVSLADPWRRADPWQGVLGQGHESRKEVTEPSHEAQALVLTSRLGCEACSPEVRRLLGEYVESGTNHGKCVFVKGQGSDDRVYLYYWNHRDDPYFSGWWLGKSVGSAEVYGRTAINSQHRPRPAEVPNWRIPHDGQTCEDVSCVPKCRGSVQTSANRQDTHGQDHYAGASDTISKGRDA
eukprot:NODE_617_length_1444_cov_283.271418.p1 GENE.NODE_617_length_1444_cov_283.271418~~NODE_617_length_1444_cov_283.271418.p1  ORF type:complete len:446 (-),score=81.59 NODE_617_length_1444_cov_283.271418:107-1360(-)